MPLRLNDSVRVTSEAYKGNGTVKFVYPTDHTVGISPDAKEPSVAALRGRSGGGLFIVRESECKIIGGEDPKAVRRPVVRTWPWPMTIGLAGPKKVGKSTTSLHLDAALRRLKLTPLRSAFASPLYRAVSEITGIDEDILRDQQVKDTPLTAEQTSNPCLIGRTPREILEWLGQGIRDFLGLDHWVHRAFAKKATLPGTILVFEDARHGPEYEVCDLVFELRRDGLEYPGNHPSAMPPNPDDVDHVIDMNGATPEHVADLICARVIDDCEKRQLAW